MDAMSELFDLLPEPAHSGPSVEPSSPTPMTAAQRSEIRRLFGELGVATAREQFDLVNVLIGVRLESVAGLEAKAAALLIPRLQQRVDSKRQVRTGDSWADRDGDTWIDQM